MFQNIKLGAYEPNHKAQTRYIYRQSMKIAIFGDATGGHLEFFYWDHFFSLLRSKMFKKALKGSQDHPPLHFCGCSEMVLHL